MNPAYLGHPDETSTPLLIAKKIERDQAERFIPELGWKPSFGEAKEFRRSWRLTFFSSGMKPGPRLGHLSPGPLSLLERGSS